METRYKKINANISTPLAGANATAGICELSPPTIKTSKSMKRPSSMRMEIPNESTFKKTSKIIKNLPEDKKNNINAHLNFYLLINAIKTANHNEIRKIAFNFPGLAILTFDLSTDTQYKNISAFQFSLLMMDFNAVNTLLAGAANSSSATSLLKKLEEQYNQLIESIESRHLPIQNLINKIEKYINQYDKNSFKDNETYWCLEVGGEMRKTPPTILKHYYCKNTAKNESNLNFYISRLNKKTILMSDSGELHPEIGLHSALVRGKGPFARTSKNPLASGHKDFLVDDLAYLKNKHQHYINALKHFSENFRFITSKVQSGEYNSHHVSSKSDDSTATLLNRINSFKRLKGDTLFFDRERKSEKSRAEYKTSKLDKK